MGFIKRMLHEVEELYNIEDGMETPYLVTAHIHGLCLKCGNIGHNNHGLCRVCLQELISS